MAHDEQWEAMRRGWEFKNQWRWDGTIEEREREEASKLEKKQDKEPE